MSHEVAFCPMMRTRTAVHYETSVLNAYGDRCPLVRPIGIHPYRAFAQAARGPRARAEPWECSRDCELSKRHRFISFPIGIGMKEGHRDAFLYCPRP